MKYNTEEALREILLRGEALQKKTNRHRIRFYSGCMAVCFILLVLSLCLSIKNCSVRAVPSVYGSFLLPADAGGYVLAAVIAFVAGILVTVAVIHKRNEKYFDRIDSESDYKMKDGGKKAT